MGFFCDTFFFRFFLFCWFVLTCNGSSISSRSVKRSSYIIHMDKSLMPKAFISHHHWYSSTLDSLNANDSVTSNEPHPTPTLLYTYDHVAHGFSAVLSLDELEAIKKSPGFVSAYSDRIDTTMDTTHTTDFLSLNPSSGLWPASNFGDGAIIGLLDTGIWPESKSFKDDGMTAIPSKWKGKCEEGPSFNSSMCNLKLIGARSYYKGLSASNPDIKLPEISARDTDGHGTHTASIAAGNYVKGASFFGYAEGTARGVAPRGRLAVYKVYWWPGGSSTVDKLAAMDQAVEDGVDVLSISVSSLEQQYHEDPVAIGAFGAMENGVLVSFSAGNRGSAGKLRNGFPWALTVAAGTIDRRFAGVLNLGNGLTITGWSLFPASALLIRSPLYYNKSLSQCDDRELLSKFAQDAIIICETYYNPKYQIELVGESGFAGAIIISDDEELFQSTEFPSPSVVIGSKYAASVVDYAKRGTEPWASIKFQETVLRTKPAPEIASYSSRGPYRINPGIMKPDLMAPGTLVLAAYVPTQRAAKIGTNIALSSEYNLLYGTSMACPHVAGVAALLKEVHPEWSSSAIKSAMMTTANPFDNTNNPIQENVGCIHSSPFDMGSGHIDPNKAIDPGLVYDITVQDYVDYICSHNYTQKQIQTVTRSKHYNCSNPRSDLNYPSFIAFFKDQNPAINQTFRRTVTSVGSDSTTYIVKVKAPKGCTARVSPRKLTFGKKYDGQGYTLNLICKTNKNDHQFSSLVWEELGGKRTVRSPILVSRPYTFDSD